MIRIAMVEDEAAVREQLMGYVQRYTRQYGTEFSVTEFADGVDILENYRPVYDIVFLDVEMKHLDGMETARRIRALDADVVLIFITNMAQYAIKGYAVGALDYVLKPVPYFAFSQQLQKAVEKVSRHARHYLAVPVEGGLRRLDTVQIYYLESEGTAALPASSCDFMFSNHSPLHRLMTRCFFSAVRHTVAEEW